MIKNKKAKMFGSQKLQKKAIRLFNWSGKNSVRSSLGPSYNIKETRSPRLNSLQVGKTYVLKITALGPNNIGIDEFSFGYSILVPNTQLGDVVKAKIVKISNKKYKYAIAQVTKKLKTKQIGSPNYKVGDVLEVNISKKGLKGTGIATLENNYSLIIPQTLPGQTVKVQITRLRKNFAFAKLLNKNLSDQNLQLNENKVPSLTKEGKNVVKEGFKIQLQLPTKVKRFVKYLVLKINGLILLVKPTLGAKPGDVVKIKCMKVLSFSGKVQNLNSSTAAKGLAFGKIIEVQPMSALKKRLLIQGTLRQMLQSGLHFGEKTVKCHARMKKYIWFRKKGPNKNKPLVQKGRHLINLLKTRRCLNKSLTQLSKYALKGRTFLFVGTKKSATRLIARVSLFSKTSFFVNTRWLGGLLTNWKSILKSIKKIRPILKQKQTIFKRVLEKRQNIKNRLMQKAVIFRKKSKVLINKARILVSNLQKFSVGEGQEKKNVFREKLSQKASLLDFKRKQILAVSSVLLEKRRKILQKNYSILKQTLILKEKSISLETQYKNLLNELTVNRQKLRELITLLVISKQISKIQQSAKQQNNRIGVVSYGKLKTLTTSEPISQSENKQNWVIPNPPKDVINKIVLILKSQMTGNTLSSADTTRVRDSNGASSQEIAKTKVLILSKLLNQFSICLPLLEKSIQKQRLKNKELEDKLTSIKQALTLIKNKLNSYINLKNQLISQANKIKATIATERPLVRLVRRKVKKIIAQKKLIRFLPKLRFLPTPQIKISETVKYLMTNIVDPKLKYPIEIMYDEKVKNMSKKMAAARKKRWQRLEKYFGGIAKMTKMKKNQVSKNVAVIIGQKEEMNAIRECQKLGIKMFQILDTNCNPTLADHFIPANDDSRNALEYLLKAFLVHIRLAQKLRLRLKKQIKIKQFVKKTSLRKNKKSNFKRSFVAKA